MSVYNIDLSAQSYFSNPTRVDSHGFLVHEALTYALQDFPPLRGRKIYDNFDAELEHVLKHGTVKDVEGAMGFIYVRSDFFAWLDANGANLRHLNLNEMQVCEVWAARLSQRHDALTGGVVRHWRH